MSDDGVARALRVGERWLSVRRYDEALDAARRALAVEPANGAALALASQALIGLDRYPEAAQAARLTIASRPEWANGYRLLSIALRQTPGFKQGHGTAEGLSAATEAVRLAPAVPLYHANLAETSAAAGRFDLADQAIRHAISMSPASAATWVSASFVAIQARNWQAAEQAARRALMIEPGNYVAMNNLGVATNRWGGGYAGAVAFLDAARVDPRSRTARENVELVGFQYMARVSPLLLLPLLLVWPVFVAARIALGRWLVQSRPAALRPLARRVGIRVATSGRRRRRLERCHRQAVERMARPGADEEWSALKAVGRSNLLVLTGLAVLYGAAAVGYFVAVIADHRPGSEPGHLLVAVVFTAALIVMVAVIRRQRRTGRDAGAGDRAGAPAHPGTQRHDSEIGTAAE